MVCAGLTALLVLLAFASAARADCMSECQSDYGACTRTYNERGCVHDRSICMQRCNMSGGSGTEYGALAYSRATWHFGFSYGKASQSAAKQEALAECGKRSGRGGGCAVEVWFAGCGALARGPRGAFGAEQDRSLDVARAKALATCRMHAGTACRIEQWVCADGRRDPQ